MPLSTTWCKLDLFANFLRRNIKKKKKIKARVFFAFSFCYNVVITTIGREIARTLKIKLYAPVFVLFCFLQIKIAETNASKLNNDKLSWHFSDHVFLKFSFKFHNFYFYFLFVLHTSLTIIIIFTEPFARHSRSTRTTRETSLVYRLRSVDPDGHFTFTYSITAHVKNVRARGQIQKCVPWNKTEF